MHHRALRFATIVAVFAGCSDPYPEVPLCATGSIDQYGYCETAPWLDEPPLGEPWGPNGGERATPPPSAADLLIQCSRGGTRVDLDREQRLQSVVTFSLSCQDPRLDDSTVSLGPVYRLAHLNDDLVLLEPIDHGVPGEPRTERIALRAAVTDAPPYLDVELSDPLLSTLRDIGYDPQYTPLEWEMAVSDFDADASCITARVSGSVIRSLAVEWANLGPAPRPFPPYASTPYGPPRCRASGSILWAPHPPTSPDPGRPWTDDGNIDEPFLDAGAPTDDGGVPVDDADSDAGEPSCWG